MKKPEPLEKNEPLFFKKQCKSDKTEPNAIFIRTMGAMPNGKEVVEVRYQGEPWTCFREDVKTWKEAVVALALRWRNENDAVRVAGDTLGKRAKKLSPPISATTLRKRLRFVQNHLGDGSVTS